MKFIVYFFVQMPIVKERRRFTDVMEEEQFIRKEHRVQTMGREEFSLYKLQGGEEMEVCIDRVPSKAPYKNIKANNLSYYLNVCTFQQVHQHIEIKCHIQPSLCLCLLIPNNQTRNYTEMDRELSMYMLF